MWLFVYSSNLKRNKSSRMHLYGSSWNPPHRLSTVINKESASAPVVASIDPPPPNPSVP